ncbi:hypothetical protein MN608_05197 [Microdochium nivale]|nr:hypothetical protein MN608_05197 [Microdochium nivale]
MSQAPPREGRTTPPASGLTGSLCATARLPSADGGAILEKRRQETEDVLISHIHMKAKCRILQAGLYCTCDSRQYWLSHVKKEQPGSRTTVQQSSVAIKKLLTCATIKVSCDGFFCRVTKLYPIFVPAVHEMLLLLPARL